MVFFRESEEGQALGSLLPVNGYNIYSNQSRIAGCSTRLSPHPKELCHEDVYKTLAYTANDVSLVCARGFAFLEVLGLYMPLV
jgi:hypothetical protein